MEYEMFDYLRHIRPRVASTTYQRKLWQLQSFLKYLSSMGKNVADVLRADVEDYLGGLTCSQVFKQAICGVVREFYDVLKMRHPYFYPLPNPAKGIEFKPDKSRKLPNVPSQAAIEEIFARLAEQTSGLHIRNSLMAELAYGSGLRRAELARLDIEDINLESNTARVTGKGDKPRVVPLTAKTAATFREYISRRHASRGPLLTTSTGRRLKLGAISWNFKNNIGLRPHLFRHACATHMLKNGCGIRTIQELLGHNRLSSTYLYTAVDKTGLKKVLETNHPRAEKLDKNP